MLKVVRGSWTTDDEFFYKNSTDWIKGISNIQKLAQALVELKRSYDNDWDMFMDALGVGEAISDKAMFTQAYDKLIFVNHFSINKLQYSQYVWLCAVLRHTLTNGELIYNHRTVLLDLHEPDDSFINDVTE